MKLWQPISVFFFLSHVAVATEEEEHGHGVSRVNNATVTLHRDLVISSLNPFAPRYRLQPREAFVRSAVCVDPTEPDCDAASSIFFSSDAVLPVNGFRYQPSGPEVFRGVFWLQASGDRASILTSFAPTRAGEGVDTGVLEQNFEGMAYVKRPVSDQSWAYGFGEGGGGFSFADLGDSVDGIYRFQLSDGTLDSPRAFRVYPTLLFLPLSRCLHFGLFNFLYDWFFSFRLSLLPDSAHTYTGSVVWRRQTLLFFGLLEIPSANFNYNVVQIIDGNGDPIQPAYDEWVAWVKTNTENKVRFDRLEDSRVDDYVDC